MSPSWPLSRKILLLALLNVVLLGLVLAVFARAQFRFGPESLLLGPARDRLRSLGDSFALEYQALPEEKREALPASYHARYGADFYLLDPRGQHLAGEAIDPAREILARMQRLVPPPRRRPAPPPRRNGPPPRREGGPPDRFGPPDDEAGPPRDDPGPPREGPPRMPPESVFLFIAPHPSAYWAGVRLELADLGTPGNVAFLLIRSDSLFTNRLFFDWRLWAAAALSLVGVSVLCWLPFIRGLTHSIAQLDRATQQIAEGRFDVPVPGGRRDELGHLGGQINRMASRLESFVKNQKRFLGDIAHELCAPIARIQFALGILEQRSDESQRAHVAALHEEIQEMSALVNELLSFSKAGLRADATPLAPVDIETVVRQAVSREAQNRAEVTVTVDPGLTAVANEVLLLRALSNVVRNAVRYAGGSGPIAVTAVRDGSNAVITIADSGPGLPESELEEVFAPFYRPESARTRETGGAGLGLAIVRTCIEACKGTVSCRNRTPSGLEVTIRLDARLTPPS